MLIVTNRPSVYVLIDGVTVELEVDKPTEVPDFQGESLLKREICMVVVDEPELVKVEVTEEVSKKVDFDIEKPASKKAKQLK
jgi:hypothetical protein